MTCLGFSGKLVLPGRLVSLASSVTSESAVPTEPTPERKHTLTQVAIILAGLLKKLRTHSPISDIRNLPVAYHMPLIQQIQAKQMADVVDSRKQSARQITTTRAAIRRNHGFIFMVFEQVSQTAP